jgi:hypothetical protein
VLGYPACVYGLFMFGVIAFVAGSGFLTWRGLAAALTTVFLGGACVGSTATRAELASYRARAGHVVLVDTSPSLARGRYAWHRVRLTSSTGLTVVGQLLRPSGGPTCSAAVLLQDGREENSAVIGRLPAEFGDVVVLSLDYPTEVPQQLRLRDATVHAARVRDAARDIPSGFLLAAAYLAQRSDVDTTRLALAATSFAVPFATIAAAADTRFRNVALIYGAGDLPSVVAANLTSRPRVFRRPLAWLATRPFAAFAPERFIGLIAPRPIVFVNGADDPQMPVAAVHRLFDAARAPKSAIWLRTGHLMPTDSALIRTLVDTAFATLSVLRAPSDLTRCRATSQEARVTSDRHPAGQAPNGVPREAHARASRARG